MDDLRQATVTAVRGRLDQLVEELGRAEPALMAVEALLGRLDEAVAAVCDAEDATARDGAAHQLAGSAETLGAMPLGAAAREVMRLAREEPDQPLPDEIEEQLRAAATVTADVLRDEVARRRD